jgi:hypothetical protein
MTRAVLVNAGVFLAMLGVARPQTTTAPSSQSFTVPAQARQSPQQQAAVPPNQASDQIFDLPPLKPGPASLMGGALESIDRVRDRLVLRPYGQGRLTIAFDPRTRFLRGEQTVRAQDMRPGDRVYVETVLNGTTVFAKTVHLPADTALGAVNGQVTEYDAAQGNLSVRDELSSGAARFRVTSKTVITGGDVAPGALVQLSFLPGEAPPVVREIRVVVAPGAVFNFSGRITFLDLSAQALVLASATDGNRYELQINPAALEGESMANLREGASVNISARFNGKGYVAEKVTVSP